MKKLKMPKFLLFSLALTTILGLPSLSGAEAPLSKTLHGQIHTSATPEVRVTAKVDNSKRTTLYGHVPGALRMATDLGRLDAKTPAQHLVLVLKSSDSQKSELRRVLDEQQDSSTANYHQWVTPEDFGAYFGAHDNDIAQVSAWLESEGFTVEDVSKSKRVLHFSGTTGQLETAFKTEMHSYSVHGETHVSNNSEISVPSALSPVIAGVSLHNFFRKGNMGPVQHLKDLQSNPLYSSSTTVHYVGPWDFAKIYNTFPMLNAGITGAGSSIAVVGRSDILLSDVQTYRQLFDLPVNDPIFIHAGQDNGTEPGDDGESDLDVEISGGIAQNAKVYFVIGTPTFLVDGITNSIQYIVENNTADIMSISYGSCEATEGVGGNEFNNQAFEQAAAQGISVFVAAGDNGPAECDDQNDSWENLGYSTGGESSTPYTVSVGGTGGYEGTTAALEAVYWSTTTQSAPYYGLSALSYMPEVPWNSSKDADASDDPSADLSGLWSGSGGISSYYLQPSWQRGSGVPTTDPALAYGGDWVTAVNLTNAGGKGYTAAPTVTFTGGGCVNEPAATTTISGGSVTGIVFNYGTQGGTLQKGQGFGCTSAPVVAFGAAPSGGTTATGTAVIGAMWNTPPLVSGVPHRYTPDLVLNADADHNGTLFCSEGVCEISATGTMEDAGIVGGTSVAAPSMAGIQALINQANGGRQGAPNYIYYALAAAQNATPSSEAACNSALGNAIGSNCVFQDITVGDNLICGASTCTSATQKMGWKAGSGYDLASGLGSVNAANLSKQWKSVVFNSSNTSLNLSRTTGIPQGGSVTFSGTVAAGSASGTPTGDVAFILSQGAFGQTVNVNTGAFSGAGAFATLSGGSYTATLENLPAGTYTVTARYGGDQTFASSLSTPVTVTVNPGNSQVTITPEWFNDTSTCTLAYVNSYNYGQFAWIPAAVTATSGQGVPTGTVTFTVDGVTYATETLDPDGNGYLAAGTLATTSCIYDYIFAQSPTLTGGVHTIGASYSGDNTFSPATATPVAVTINKLTVGGTVSTGSLDIVSGATVPLTASLTSTALTGISTLSSGPTGTETFTDTTTNTVLGTVPVIPAVAFSGNTYTFTATAALSTSALTTSGAHSIVGSYSGDSNYNSATSGALTVTVETAAATTTTVTSSANPTTLNGRPTLTATIAAASGTAPTSGTVSFYDNYAGNPVLLGTGTVGSAHTATFKPASGAAFFGGAHPITAVYAGIAADAGSTSAVFTENVTLGTTTDVLTAKTQGAVGQNFTFAAVLTPSSTTAAFAPNQSVVNFYDGATLIGSAQPITVTSTQGGYGLWTATLTVNNLTAGTHTITATYSDINYSPSTSNAETVTVEGIAWTTPAAITYPAALSASQLNATDTVAGVFSYTPTATTVLNAGAQTLSVLFTPTDTVHYVTQTATVQLQVNQAAQTITFPALASSVGYGVVPIALGATSNSGLAVAYTVTGPATLSGNSLLITGVGTVKVTAAQAGNVNYNAATSVSQSITVTPAVLTVTANNLSTTVGVAVPTLTASYNGFANGDTVSVLSGSPSLVTAATSTSAVGLYPITITRGTLAASNYTFAFVNGSISVSAAAMPTLTTSATLSLVTGGYTATVIVSNSGKGAASNVQLTTATLGAAAATTALPLNLGTIAAGASTTVSISFPASAGTVGAASTDKFAGTYTGGSFSSSGRVTLP